jgi:hypothetical protein
MNQNIEILRQIFYTIPHLFVLVVCSIYAFRKASLDGILLAVGSMVSLLASLSFLFINPLLHKDTIGDSMSSYMLTINIIGIISNFGSVIFAVGLFLLLLKAMKNFQK